MTTPEHLLEDKLIEKLRGLKYEYRADIRDRSALEKNFREKFESLNHVRLTDAEFARLLDEIIAPDVFTAAKTVRSINAFTRDDGTPLNYTLVNIKDWCKNTYEVINQLRINTDNIAKFSAKGPGKSKMTREELIGLISSDAKFMNERDDIAEYIGTLKAGEGLSETAIREGYTRFKAEKNAKELAAIAAKHQLATAALQTFVDGILDRMIFDGEHLSDLMAPLDLGWRARIQAELALMADLFPVLTKRAGGRDISGLSAYEQ